MMFKNIQPNNELTDLLMWITGRGYNVMMEENIWATVILVTKGKKNICMYESDVDFVAARLAKHHIENNL